MLQQLLRQLTHGQLQPPEEVARTLGTTPALVAQMTEQLVARGYLQSNAAQGATSCAHCPLHTVCNTIKRQPRLWSLTAKGERAMRKEV
ncbi:MAG TPA: hypothetical protein G4N98_09780 [Thermoflexia bacterium]|nr:hypothetical protein [Thermoflexia bacterium]